MQYVVAAEGYRIYRQKVPSFAAATHPTRRQSAVFVAVLDVSLIHHQNLRFSASVLEIRRNVQKTMSFLRSFFWIIFQFLAYVYWFLLSTLYSAL